MRLMYIPLVISFMFANILANNFYDNRIEKLFPSSSVVIKYQEEWQVDLYKKRIENFKNNPIGYDKIVLLGNSITEGGGDWNKKLNAENVVNRGISGDITDGILNRLEEIVYFRPIAVFLLIGINDIFNSDKPEQDKVTVKYVANNIIEIADRIKSKSPKTQVYIQTVLPINRELFFESAGYFPEHKIPLNIQIIEINKIIKNIASQRNHQFLNLHTAFIDDKGSLSSEYTTDGVHLNDNGYSLWAKLLIKHIRVLNNN